ncbi:P-loop containing nucleoside triphosphate hydrolase protein, partial [Dendryphion nanum]
MQIPCRIFYLVPNNNNMDPSIQNLNYGLGSQYINYGTGSQYNAHTQNIHVPPGRLGDGPCSATLTVMLEPVETPPSSSCTIPFCHDPDFIDRGTLLDQVLKKCSAPASKIALVGLGGVGKSQLAIEHAHRTHERSPETWVFWVYASNAVRFEQSYRDIADRVKISGRRDSKANIFQLVHDWLRDGKSRWLLILDNVDDARFLLDSQATGHGQTAGSDSTPRPLRDYLPRCDRGSILVTTRNREAALELVEERDIITVEPMDKAQALALFEKKLGAKEDSTEVNELAAALEYMPLAIVQAAAYITQRAPRCSVRQYLEEFEKNERKKTSLLHRDGGKLRRDNEAKNSIIVTWEISFEYIRDTRPSAADLLSLMSFFDRQGIPEELLRNRTERGDAEGQEGHGSDDQDSDGDDDDDDASQSSTSEGGVEDEFEDDVLALRNFCFVSVDIDGTSFEMHALVQLATRKWLEANGTLERWKQQFVDNLCAAFPTGKYENWARCQALFPHAKAAAGQKPEGKESLAQ